MLRGDTGYRQAEILSSCISEQGAATANQLLQDTDSEEQHDGREIQSHTPQPQRWQHPADWPQHGLHHIVEEVVDLSDGVAPWKTPKRGYIAQYDPRQHGVYDDVEQEADKTH